MMHKERYAEYLRRQKRLREGDKERDRLDNLVKITEAMMRSQKFDPLYTTTDLISRKANEILLKLELENSVTLKERHQSV